MHANYLTTTFQLIQKTEFTISYVSIDTADI